MLSHDSHTALGALVNSKSLPQSIVVQLIVALLACTEVEINDKGEEEEDKDVKTKKPIHRAKILEDGFEF